MEKFNWKKVATINQALEFFSVVCIDILTFISFAMYHLEKNPSSSKGALFEKPFLTFLLCPLYREYIFTQ